MAGKQWIKGEEKEKILPQEPVKEAAKPNRSATDVRKSMYGKKE